MEVIQTLIEDGTVQYECRDDDGKMYGVADTIQEGMVVDTLVLDMETLDEIEDSDLFKRILMARAHYLADDYQLMEEIRHLY